jgi:hypothetical protein
LENPNGRPKVSVFDFTLTPRVISFFELLLMTEDNQTIKLILRKIQRFNIPELPDFINRLFVAISQLKQIDKLDSVLRRIQIPQSIMQHKSQIMEFMHDLITLSDRKIGFIDHFLQSFPTIPLTPIDELCSQKPIVISFLLCGGSFMTTVISLFIGLT